MHTVSNEEMPQQYAKIPCGQLRAIDHAIEDLFSAVEDQVAITRDIAELICDVRKKVDALVIR